ncbi:hypothetical protein M231_07845 [Tremella mesenterica]|uniref:Uncharacterized protein n=1 Tax=Tremella mesenterica TaxID=5217 RepID=A0A4Q1BA84_TREME|nr:hypothetical protein M231_07845 [Tremella mesenterica]
MEQAQRADETDKILKQLTEGLKFIHGSIENLERQQAEGIKSVNQRLESIVSRLDCLGQIVAASPAVSTTEAELATNDQHEAGGPAVDHSGHLDMDMTQDLIVHSSVPPSTGQDVFRRHGTEESGTDDIGMNIGLDIGGVEDGGMDDVKEMMRSVSRSSEGTPSGDSPETVRRQSSRPRSRTVDYHSHPLDGKKLSVTSPKKKKGKREPGQRSRAFKGRVWLNNKCLSASDVEKRGEGVWPAKSENTVKGKMQEVVCNACKG